MLELLGQTCGVENRAQALTDYYEEQLARVAQLVDGLERPTVYMGGNSSYLTAAPSDMYQSSLIETAGGVNAAGDLTGGYWTEVSYESILAMAPQVILIPPWRGLYRPGHPGRSPAGRSARRPVRCGL